MSRDAQLMCFLAGANSIFYGEQLLTTGNPDTDEDLAMLRDAGLRALVPEDPEKGVPASTEELPGTQPRERPEREGDGAPAAE
jgi:biotin synthase